MGTKAILLVFVLCSALAAENLEKTQKKELEAQVRTMTAEAERLEKAGQLAEARTKYAESQALIEMKDVTDALKRLDEEIHKRVKETLSESRKLYELRKFKEAATALDEGMKLQAFQPVLAYDLALCYYQLGERNKALEYLGRAKAGTADPKQKQKLLQLLTFFTTGENGLLVSDSDKDRISRVNRLSEMQEEMESRSPKPTLHPRNWCLRRLSRQTYQPVCIAIPMRIIGRACAMRWASSRAL
jgi:tetratricopeptide (TPR) repeat protein